MKIKVFIPGLCGAVCPKVLIDYYAACAAE